MSALTNGARERAETSIQSVVLVPVILLVVFMCFHLGAYFHQSHVAEFIASRGAEIAGASGVSAASRDSAVREMEMIAADLGSRFVAPPVVSYEQGGVRVKVVLRVPAATPLLPASTSAVVRHSHESFLLEQDRV